MKCRQSRLKLAVLAGSLFLVVSARSAGEDPWKVSGGPDSGRVTGNSSLIWCDPVNIFESLVWFLYLSFREQGQQQPWQVMATIDQADIRGSEPHNHDPSGAASD